MEKDCQACKLNKEDAIHRTRCTWKLMRDQDGCEWVNVSPGTSLPGSSQTRGHETVVCVCGNDAVSIS